MCRTRGSSIWSTENAGSSRPEVRDPAATCSTPRTSAKPHGKDYFCQLLIKSIFILLSSLLYLIIVWFTSILVFYYIKTTSFQSYKTHHVNIIYCQLTVMSYFYHLVISSLFSLLIVWFPSILSYQVANVIKLFLEEI